MFQRSADCLAAALSGSVTSPVTAPYSSRTPHGFADCFKYQIAVPVVNGRSASMSAAVDAEPIPEEDSDIVDETLIRPWPATEETIFPWKTCS